MRRLAVDYAFEYSGLSPFFAGNPADPIAWAGAISRAQAYDRPRAAIVAMLQAQQARRNSPPAARAAVAALASPSTVAIVTGQQAGLFGGPVFTLLKAVTAIRLSARLSREHGVTAVPVFWIDAEDHDWDEIAGCGVLAADQTLRRVEVGAPEGAGERTVASLHYTDQITQALEQLAATLPATEYTGDLLDALREAYQPGRGVAEAFARFIDRVLGPHGLVATISEGLGTQPLYGFLGLLLAITVITGLTSLNLRPMTARRSRSSMRSAPRFRSLKIKSSP